MEVTEKTAKAQELESLRIKIENLDRLIGRTGDLRDRFGADGPGMPSPETYRKWMEDREEGRKELKERITTTRSEEHLNIIKLCLSWHETICKMIIEENDTRHKNSEKENEEETSLNSETVFLSCQKDTAKEVLREIQKVLKGKSFCFAINLHYLPDYYTLMKEHTDCEPEGIDLEKSYLW
ncbi:MAG: hypothetical protein PQJ58_22100 [Spirochaetales bacterium]|nr:hypothetical protein [Spirochaetales bacterium]